MITDITTTKPNWIEIETAYRAGRETLRSIADRNGVSHVAIQKRAKKEGWVRDLAGKIAAKAEALVTRSVVTKTVTKEQLVTEREIVDANAALQADIIRSERSDITRYRGLVTKLFSELESTTDNLELFEQLAEIMRDSSDQAGVDKLNDLYRRIISLPGRVDIAKKLVETMEKLINAERRVFNIKEEEAAPPPMVTEIRLVAVMPGQTGRTYDAD